MPKAGGQPGNNNGGKGKEWADAVRKALFIEVEELDDEGKKQKKIDKAATQLADMACAGDIQAIKECGDRLDGKPAQAITGPSGEPITLVECVIIRQAIDNQEDSKVIEGEVIQEKVSKY